MSMRTAGGKTGRLPGGAKPVTDPLTVAKFSATSSNISGTTKDLEQSLKELEADLKRDKVGLKEYTDMLSDIERKKADLQKRIDANKKWVESFEKNDESGSMEQQYKGLMDNVQSVYEGAKEFHAKGIDMLIKEFDYHPAYKRCTDKFTAVPFKPK